MKIIFMLLVSIFLQMGYMPHQDDNYICPEASVGQSVKSFLQECESLKVFAEILHSHDMLNQLEEGERWGILAPVNEAFTELETEAYKQFMENERLQRSVLNRHVVRRAPAMFSPDIQMTQFRGRNQNGETVNLGMAEVLVRNIELENGTLHIVGDLIWAEGRRVRN